MNAATTENTTVQVARLEERVKRCEERELTITECLQRLDGKMDTLLYSVIGALGTCVIGLLGWAASLLVKP